MPPLMVIVLKSLHQRSKSIKLLQITAVLDMNPTQPKFLNMKPDASTGPHSFLHGCEAVTVVGRGGSSLVLERGLFVACEAQTDRQKSVN